jgi:hypothetical protein
MRQESVRACIMVAAGGRRKRPCTGVAGRAGPYYSARPKGVSSTMSEPNRCGPHTQITSSDDVRISQCPCGTYHLNFQRHGVTMQMGAAELRSLAEATGVALRVADAEARGKALAATRGPSTN